MPCKKKKITWEDIEKLKVGESLVGPAGTFENVWPEERPKKKKPRIGMSDV